VTTAFEYIAGDKQSSCIAMISNGNNLEEEVPKGV
jgi:hypothetical protein